MGVSGLMRVIEKKYMVRHGSEYLIDGEYHIDGFNFALQLLHSECLNAENFRKRFREQIMLLLSLRPREVIFYLDGFIPEKKIPTRVERKSSLLKKMEFDTPLCVGELCLCILRASFPQIKTIITGIEADDAIAKAVAQSTGQCKKFIFSNDSDMLTFILPNSDTIEVVPLTNCDEWPKTFASYNLDKAQNSALVQRHFRRPQNYSGWQVENPVYPVIRVVEFVNTARHHKNAAVFLPILPYVNDEDPYLPSRNWRTAAYYFLCEKHSLKIDQIHEYHQLGRERYMCSVVHKSTSQLAFEQLDALRTTSLAQLLLRELLHSKICNELPKEKFLHLETYIYDFLSGKLLTHRCEPTQLAKALVNLIRGTLISIEFLHMCFWDEIPVNICELVSNAQPSNLQTYLS